MVSVNTATTRIGAVTVVAADLGWNRLLTGKTMKHLHEMG